jgi:uncharacterized Tic20 family protein
MATGFDTKVPLPEKPGYVPTEEERTWGLMAHLSGIIAGFVVLPFLGPLIVWLIKKDQSPFIADQAKEALNFQIALLIAVLICVVVPCVGWVMLIPVAIGGIVYAVIGAMEANKGVYYRYPYTIRLIN